MKNRDKLRDATPAEVRAVLDDHKAIYSDFDGVLVPSTEGLFIDAYKKVLRDYNIKPKLSFLVQVVKARSAAKNSDNFWPALIGHMNKTHGIPESELDRSLQLAYQYAKNDLKNVKLNPDAPEFLWERKNAGHDLGLVTATSRFTIDTVTNENENFKNANFSEIFEDKIITADEASPKYKAYGQMLDASGHHPDEVVAIEDSKGGVDAARKAGIKKVIIYKDPSASFLTKHILNAGIDKLSNLKADSFAQLRKNKEDK